MWLLLHLLILLYLIVVFGGFVGFGYGLPDLGGWFGLVLFILMLRLGFWVCCIFWSCGCGLRVLLIDFGCVGGLWFAVNVHLYLGVGLGLLILMLGLHFWFDTVPFVVEALFCWLVVL